MVAERATKGEIGVGTYLEEILGGGLKVALAEAPRERANEEFTIQAAHYYGRDVDVLQIVLPDTKGRFPWDEGYEERFRAAQEAMGPLRQPPEPAILPGPSRH